MFLGIDILVCVSIDAGIGRPFQGQTSIALQLSFALRCVALRGAAGAFRSVPLACDVAGEQCAKALKHRGVNVYIYI